MTTTLTDDALFETMMETLRESMRMPFARHKADAEFRSAVEAYVDARVEAAVKRAVAHKDEQIDRLLSVAGQASADALRALAYVAPYGAAAAPPVVEGTFTPLP